MTRLGVLPATVYSAMSSPINRDLKQHYLLYDNLTFGDNLGFLELLCKTREYFRTNALEILNQRIEEYTKLIDKNIVINITLDEKKIQYTNDLLELNSELVHFDEITRGENEPLKFGLVFHDHFARWKAVLINQQYENIKAFPVVINDTFLTKDNSIITTQEEALNIILSKFPVVDRNISWDRIIEFKNDTDSQLKLFKLLNWATDLTKSNYSIQEVIEKIEYLTLEYEAALKLHKLKYNISTFQSYVLGATEFIENLIKLNFTSILKSTLEVKKQNIEMLEAEKQLPGNEIAYFIKAKGELSQ